MRLSPGCDAFLQDQVPNGWQDAAAHARRLATRLEYLPWADRMVQLDDFVWSEARRLLSNEEITAVINRLRHSQGGSWSILEYATVCSSILTGVLLQLKEPRDIASPIHAMALLLSRKTEHQQLAASWVRAMGHDALEGTMNSMPGFAFMFLATYPNDSAESFMARDAFWAAMLGR